MERYIAVDSGKKDSKIAVYDVEKDEVRKMKFSTKMSKGYFEDDALESNTNIVEYEGNIYKVGRGALVEAEMETSKKKDIHKICTLLAIARECSSNEVDEVHVGIGLPVKEWENVEIRNEYRNFILPDDEISLIIKTSSDKEPIKKTFRIVSKHVYPEGKGALFISDNVNVGTVGTIDIGHLNINNTVWTNLDIDHRYSLTDVLGGNNLITGLSQELSSEFSLCDERTTLCTLLKPKESRFLAPNKPNKEVEQKSKKIIDEYLLNHVKEIKRKCDSKRWSLDYMDLVFIGGTTKLLRNEIVDVFGNTITIPEDPEYANVLGFLRIMCGKLLEKQITL